MSKRFMVVMLVVALALVSVVGAGAAGNGKIGINVVLNEEISDANLAALGEFGNVSMKIESINAVSVKARASDLDAIRALPFVAAASPDAERYGIPMNPVEVEDFSGGVSTWDLDAINVTDMEFDGDGVLTFNGRTEELTGEGVYVAVLDTGLVDTWRNFFPEERIATEYAKSFGGGGGEQGNVSEQPNKWEHDQNSHGTHVTSTILGYSLNGTPINGVAPLATVIPVKVLNNNGSGWSMMVAAGISYVGDLKAGPLANYPVVINMSLGGPELDVVEKEAIDYAISQGVIIVTSAGNEDEAGMGFPGAYEPVVSVAAAGWQYEWYAGSWWRTLDVPEGASPEQFYIAGFSSWALPGAGYDSNFEPMDQDLDVAAPGSWVVGPYKINSGNRNSYYYLGGTSMASPHVAGIAALMLQKNAGLTQTQVEDILTGAADDMGEGCMDVFNPNTGAFVERCWGPYNAGSGFITADAALAATP